MEINGQKKEITPRGHIEERWKTIRQFEGVRIRSPRNSKRTAHVEFDESGERLCVTS